MSTLLVRQARSRDLCEVRPLRLLHGVLACPYQLASEPVGGAAKRVFDIVASSIALLVLSPLLVFVAILIRQDSPGPALYRQKRTGFRGCTFTILKFRTMRTMEDARYAAQAKPGDDRVTRIGRFLRRTSIDELPQLINVLRGEMSLVGPRPHALRHDRDFFRTAGVYPRRFLARPGITGAAQVAGARGVTDTPEKLEKRLMLDLDYIENWSFLRDLAILVATVGVVLGGENAC